VSVQSELETLLGSAGVAAPLVERLARYGSLVLEANRRFNLTGAKTPADFAPHIVDSLTVAPLVEHSLIDIGSGGGLPAIPIALVTGVPVTMVETTVKKARFLEEMLAEFGLTVEVIAERAEVAAHEPRLREQFYTGTARAVSSAPTVAELLLPFVTPGGKALLQRGTIDAPEHRALEDAALMLGGAIEEELPLDGDRRIIIVRKTGSTQARFPRRVGIPEKRPLCM
jgi:16S rRNA (guanine527-N7)-methyltransferase